MFGRFGGVVAIITSRSFSLAFGVATLSLRGAVFHECTPEGDAPVASLLQFEETADQQLVATLLPLPSTPVATLLPFEESQQIVSMLLPFEPEPSGDVATLLQFDGNADADDEVASMLLPFEETSAEAGQVVSMLLPFETGPVAVLLQFEDDDDDDDDEPVSATLLPLE